VPRPREKNLTGTAIGAALGALVGGPAGSAVLGALGGAVLGSGANPPSTPVALKEAIAAHLQSKGLRLISFGWLSPRRVQIGFGRGGNYFQKTLGVAPHPTRWQNRVALEDALYDSAVAAIDEWVSQFAT
jgi:hypothetical protein